MSETPKKTVYELPKMVTDNPQGNFEMMLNLVYEKDGWSYIRYSEDGTDGMPITDFCFKKLCPMFGCSVFADQTMTDEKKDEFLFYCVFDNCPVATVYAALSGYGHLRDRLRKHEDAMTNRVLTLEEATGSDEPVWLQAMGRVFIADVCVAPDARMAQIQTIGKASCEYLPLCDYGVLWRCWLCKPTKEDRDTPWEE